jgi:Ca2+-binding RTX toxin-like protein
VATNIGTAGNDKIIGKSFADLLFGRAGKDYLDGRGGNDKIDGGRGADKLFGGRGNDVLKGGAGDDIMKGGSGADRFVFKKGSGKDVISDFDVNKDVLQIPKGLNNINTPKDVLKHATQVGADVVIKLSDTSSIKLKNVSLNDLKAQPSDHFDIV